MPDQRLGNPDSNSLFSSFLSMVPKFGPYYCDKEREQNQHAKKSIFALHFSISSSSPLRKVKAEIHTGFQRQELKRKPCSSWFTQPSSCNARPLPRDGTPKADWAIPQQSLNKKMFQRFAYRQMGIEVFSKIEMVSGYLAESTFKLGGSQEPTWTPANL